MYNGLMNPNDRRVRRFPPVNVPIRLFQQGDLVKYVGEKLGKELNGKIGHVDARVGGEDHLLVVDFGEDQARLIDERNLAITVRSAKTEDGEREEKTKKPEVQKRKGVRRQKDDNAE